MSTERDMTEVLQQYMDENKMHCMEGTRGVRHLEKLATALGYDSNFSASVLHAFLEDNSGCIEAMVEWIGSRNSPEWKESLESQLMEVESSEED